MRLLVISISLKNVFKLWHSNQKNERDISQNFFQKFKNGITCVQIWSFFLVRIFPYSVKKGVLRNFALFTGKHLSWSHFLKSCKPARCCISHRNQSFVLLCSLFFVAFLNTFFYRIRENKDQKNSVFGHFSSRWNYHKIRRMK